MRHKYPKYTHGFIDHDGSPRFYLRLPDRKRVPLPGLPWSPEFMAAREMEEPRKDLRQARCLLASVLLQHF